MKLLLTSTGLSTERIRKKFLSLLGKAPQDCKLAFIPTAGYPEIIQKYVDEALEPLNKMGVAIKVIDLKEKSYDELEKLMSDVDVIWVNGGNTFWLLYWVNKSGFNKLIKEYVKQGKLYVGVSAGSILVCPTIETSGWKGLDDQSVAKLDNYQGLGLFHFNLFVHYEDKWKKLVTKESATLSEKLLCLRDDEAVVVENGRREIIKGGE